MGVFQNHLMAAAVAKAAESTDFYDYQITHSLRFNGTNQALEKTWGTAASNDDAKAISVWIKRSGASNTNSGIGSTTNTKICSANDFNQLEINTNNPTGYSDQFGYIFNSGNNANWSKAKWRDPSAWLHLVWIWNSDESTDTDRVKVYVNGESMGTINDSNYWNNKSGDPFPSSGLDTTFGKNGNEMHIARYQYDDGGWWGGQMADFIMIDGTASISDFGETKNGVWKPVDPSGLTFGNNGFWLKFDDTSDPGNDSSGNNNDFTTIGTIPVHDFLLDSPTFNSSSNGGNFCTINSVYRGDQTSDAYYGVLTEGNLKHSYSGSSDAYCACTHKVPASGKWYWEYRIDGGGGSSSYSPDMGIMDPNEYTYADRGSDGSTGSIVYGNHDNKVYKDASISGTYSGSRGSDNEVMGIAVDMDNGAFYVRREGTWQTIDGGSQGDPESGASRTGAGATWTPASDYTSGMVPLSAPTGGSSPIITINFGQDGTFGGNETAGGNSDASGYGNFYSAVPSGYKAICSGNLTTATEIDPASTDDNFPQKLFGAILYTGNGGTNNITGLGFQPDLTWIKIRNTASNGPLVDSSRGTSKIVFSQINGAEVTSANLTAFGTDGFSLAGGLASYDPNFNGNTNTYVGWNWRANGGSTSSGSGDLTSTHQVDPSGGFSIVKAVGDGGTSGDKTVTHGMSVAPDCIICKNLDSTFNWDTYWSSGLTATSYSLRLNTTDNQQSGRWGTVNSSIFTCKYNYTWVGSDNFIYYCFRNIEGYIKVGTYKGNSNNNGGFVYTGFRPAWMLLREVAVDSWGNYDNKRIGQNNDDGKGNAVLYADSHDDEENQASRAIDLLSNGFKLRTSNATFNNAGTYVFFAMAHNPFKYATAE